MSNRVLITGASRGIGKSIALALSESGFEICIHFNQNQSAACRLQDFLVAKGSKASTIQFDISNREATRAALHRDIEEHGAFYGVVCNAGIANDGAFPALTDDDWDSVIRTNLDGFYNVLHPLIMPMIHLRKGGRIVTLSSVSGIMGNRGQVNYSAAKAGIIGATKALALEVAKRKITVNCIAPGFIETDMVDGVDTEHVLPMIPMRRAGKPEEVASLVKYLFSDEASYVTRQVISINGGLC